MTDLDRYKQHLESQGKKPSTVDGYVGTARRFLKHVDGARITPELVQSFMASGNNKRQTRSDHAVAITGFLKFMASTVPAVVDQRGGAIPPAPTKRQIKLRERWNLEQLKIELDNNKDLIAKLARKVSDHYLFFQRIARTGDADLDEVGRLAAEAQELITANLQLFMALAAGGRNVHPKIDERMRR